MSSKRSGRRTLSLSCELADGIPEFGSVEPNHVSGETVSGAALGGMPAPYGYWLAIRALCDRYGILLHLDEVMCGMGRTGTYFAFEQEGIKPDIVTVGKGLGGGYQPISAMLVNEKILNVLRQGTSSFNHGHTFQAHPVGCATALKVQQIIKRDRLVERCAEQGAKLEKMLHDVFGDAEFVADIRGRGLLKCLEFMLDPMTKTPFPQETAFGTKFQLATFDSGVAIYPGAGTVDGFVGDHVLVAPPYTVSDKELAITVSTMKKAYDRTAAELFRAKI
jgi:adenosylmethionine-8-amino-7-oxononanoate aminotransferase